MGWGANLANAANNYQRVMRHTGRPISYRKLIETTLQVNGLEFEYAYVCSNAIKLRLSGQPAVNVSFRG